MKKLIDQLKNKSIHVVGVTGAEGSSILRFLVKHKIENITVHDISSPEFLEKSFRLWHKGLANEEQEKLYRQFNDDLGKAKLNFGSEYLKDIDKADLVFVPQSWRLYKKENAGLFEICGKIPFYSLTRLYLDFAPAQIVAVTGTVGKGSTASIIYQLLKKYLPAPRQAYFAGNETWMVQSAERLDEMKKVDILVLEISHRQLQDGFSSAPHITVFTNLYPNHLDEVDWDVYKRLKLSLVNKQISTDVAILNYDMPELRLDNKLKSKVIYYSEKLREMNTKNVQRIFDQITSIKSDHYKSNLLAGITVIDNLDINIEQITGFLPQLKSLTARLELLVTISGVKIYDDIKSTTPWATLAALEKLGKDTILICGGRNKGLDYQSFSENLIRKTKKVIIVKSQLGDILGKLLPGNYFHEVMDLDAAVKLAFSQAKRGDNILISPGAGFFYTDFIKGKKSLRKLAISLLPTEQA